MMTLGNTNTAIAWLKIALTLLNIAIALPFIGYIIVNTALPEVAEIHHPRLRIGLLVIALFIAALAYTVGAKNYYVMSCYDFKIAGAHLPDNCYRGEGD